MNRRSSCRIATIKSLSFSNRLIILPCKPVFENKNNSMDMNCRSSFRIATKKSMKFYKPLNIVGKYQEMILILNHFNHNVLPYVWLSKIEKGMYAHFLDYQKQRKRTQAFFSTVGSCNTIQHLYHLYDPHVGGIYCPFVKKLIDDSTHPIINKAFVHDPTHPLLASSDKGIDLIFVPTIYSAVNSWKQCLTEDELVIINNLRIACTYLWLLLDFQLNKKFDKF